MKSRHSRRTVPTSRSQYAFVFGAGTGVRNTLSPNELFSSSSSSDEKIESRSWIKTHKHSHWGSLLGTAAGSTPQWDEQSQCNGECDGSRFPWRKRHRRPGNGPSLQPGNRMRRFLRHDLHEGSTALRRASAVPGPIWLLRPVLANGTVRRFFPVTLCSSVMLSTSTQNSRPAVVFLY
jgi:hypothetical protein